MSSSVSSIGGYSSSMISMNRPPRPDSTKLAEDLFSQIDASGKGYIEKSDLESAFSQLSSSASSADSTSSADELFAKLDSNSDGKVTQDEMSSGVKSLMDSLDSEFQRMRMSSAMGAAGANGGMPPPPPPENDTGFTKSELQDQLSEIGNSDSQRSSLISNVTSNFSAADTNGDGKVTFAEAMAYNQSSSSSSSTSNSTPSSDATSASASPSEAQLMLQVMKLAQSYGLFDAEQKVSIVSAIA